MDTFYYSLKMALGLWGKLRRDRNETSTAGER